MKITTKDVAHVALLSRLDFADGEMEKFTVQLDDILTYAEVLTKLDTEGVQPTAHVLQLRNVFREDVVRPSLDREAALHNAPLAEDGCFKVPKIVEG